NEVGDEGLKTLSRLPWLHTLSLRGNDVSNHGLVHLANLPHLTSLRIEHCRGIGDAALQQLAACRSLRHLGVATPWVSVAAAKELQNKLPDCEIEVLDGHGKKLSLLLPLSTLPASVP